MTQRTQAFLLLASATSLLTASKFLSLSEVDVIWHTAISGFGIVLTCSLDIFGL